MNRKTVLAVLGLMMGAGYTAAACAQAKPETLVKQRQAAMVLMGKYFYGELRPMAQGKRPYDAKIVARDTEYLDALSRMPWDGFDPRTKGVKSGALPAVFNEPAKFKEAQDRFLKEVSALVTAVKGGDESAIKNQILSVNKACGSCHDDFREKQ